jgi:hypothetical protein
MNLMSRVAVLAISAVPMYAQAQQSGAVKLKQDAQNVVKIVSGNKLKIQAYCEIVELSDQIDEEQGSSKAEELEPSRTVAQRITTPLTKRASTRGHRCR